MFLQGSAVEYPDSDTFANFMTAANSTDDINLTPLMIDAAGGNYHLKSVSPAVGEGITGTITSTDFSGRLFLDCGDWTIGAYAWCMGGSVVYNATGRSWKYSVKGRTAK